MKGSALLRMSLAMAAMGANMGSMYVGYGNRKSGDRSNKGLPYFHFDHEGRAYTIQAVNEVAAKAKFDKIINKKK